MADLLDAVHSEGSAERTIAAPFGEVPGSVFARFVAFDGLVHGWDLATATGQGYAPRRRRWCVRSTHSPARRWRPACATATRSPPKPKCRQLPAYWKSWSPSVGARSRTERKQDDITPSPPTDIEAIKSRQQATWASGDYAVIGTTLQIVGETLCEAVDVVRGITRARRGGRQRQRRIGRGAPRLCGDRHRLCARAPRRHAPPCRRRGLGDGHPRRRCREPSRSTTRSFDTALSTFGVMFVPDPHRAADEMVRVCRPGGAIGLANWTPEGFVGRMFKIVGAHVPPPAGDPVAAGVGHRSGSAGLARPPHPRSRSPVAISCSAIARRANSSRRSRTYYGPVLRAWGALDEAGRESFRSQLVALADECNRSTNGALAVPSEYLEVVARIG